jgi:hypothetical protein
MDDGHRPAEALKQWCQAVVQILINHYNFEVSITLTGEGMQEPLKRRRSIDRAYD